MVANGTTLSKTEVSWDDVATGNFPENPARTAYRAAVTEVADKARAVLPACNGRIDKAVQIVLAGDVELLDDGQAKVASQSNGTTKYFVVNGECECPDFPRAPEGFCKHRLACGIAKRADVLAKQKLEVMVGETPADELEPTPVPQALPEAPASVNCFVEVAGRRVQVTLRDQDETRLLARLGALLARFPSAENEADAEPEATDGWCSIHGCQMRQYSNDRGSWWSHKAGDRWCHGK